jgi:hypothetical protein
MNYKAFLLFLFMAFLSMSPSSVRADDAGGMDMGNMGEMFAHPFWAHMGIPDKPGEIDMRILGYRSRLEGMSSGDFGLHLEAGLLPGLGIHLRSDGIYTEQTSEAMVMYSPFHDADLQNGVSVFGEAEFPTGGGSTVTTQGVVGLGGRLTAGQVMVWDGDVHYNPTEKMFEYESSFVFRMSEKIYPVVEANGHSSPEMATLYVLPALKFMINSGSALGFGVRIATEQNEEYESRAELTYDFWF